MEGKKLLAVILTLVAVLVLFLVIVYVGGLINSSLKLDETGLLRFGFVGIGLLIMFLVYVVTRQSKIWEVGTREVVYMAIGAALYAVLSFLFNGTVFIVSPMFFGYAFGPWVGAFTGAVGNMFGDALTGFGLSPQWSIGNGLIGFIAGLSLLFKNRKRSIDFVLIISLVLAAIVTALFFLNREQQNLMFFEPTQNIFGDAQISIWAGLSVVIGFVLVLLVRIIFNKNIDVAAAVTWSLIGNILGIGFAAISDIWINGYPPAVAIVGEFIPAAGPNAIFAAIFVPILVVAYLAVQRQTGR
jgi:hypothetical protein